MVREIVRGEKIFSAPARKAGIADISILDDLMDTLRANAERCVGMAANMIGENVRIIVFADGDGYGEMLNPAILSKKDPYEAEEGCLSLDGSRRVKRFRTIKVRWQNRKMETRIKNFTGWTAQIIQHEIDHCDGKII